MGRGMLTEAIKVKSKKELGYEIDQVELRLLPYIQFVMMNAQKVDPNKINQEERDIISKWRGMGFIEGGAGGMKISKDFWDSMNEILWISYVCGGE